MIEDRKDYWIKIFIKKCTALQSSQEQLDYYFKWCENTYNISEDYLLELKKKHTVDEYINRLVPVINQYFSIEDLKEIIKFYSTSAGKKMLEHNFLQDIGKVGTNMNLEIEQEFSLGNNKL